MERAGKEEEITEVAVRASPPPPATQGKAQSLTGLGGIPSVVPIRCQGMEALAALGAACLAYKPGSSANLN
jgi:hypothetical protein